MKPHRFIIVLAVALGVTCGANAQSDQYGDSLSKAILKSVQGSFDSVALPSSTKKYLSNLFADVNKDIDDAKASGDIGTVSTSYRKLSSMDSMKGNYKNAYENFKLYTLYKDSLQKKEAEKRELQARMQRDFDKKQAQLQLAKEKEERNNSIKLTVLLASLLVFISVSISSLLAYKREKKAKQLVGVQKTELETTLTELKATQQQLIQSEKMASLGELTAGIAHEIQNPLNFVNNFSEVNNELIDEMSQETSLEEVKAIAADIRQNNEKITLHGKRADAIVKGMLQHSRQSKGIKEPADINALCDEYLRLAYHGFRAKDKVFNAELITHFDNSIGNISAVPQDIGRVLLNLFNNAFYAVNEKKKTGGESYKPTVFVTTKKKADSIEITVGDNGNGVPQHIIDKIFQPFFTTKSTGQGTGLGLSLTYDIITKEHNGTLQVESREGEGATFIITLPV